MYVNTNSMYHSCQLFQKQMGEIFSCCDSVREADNLVRASGGDYKLGV